MSRYRLSDIVLVAIFAACVSFQLFVPPAIGLANNGDFGKMVGRFSLGPEIGDNSDEYKYFTPRWVYDRKDFWIAGNRSSELILIAQALVIGSWFSTQVFDIRILGAIHALLWIGCFAALLPLLWRLNGRIRYATAIAALFILADASYVAHFNSFHTDTAAFLFLAWALVLWLHFVVRDRPSPGLFALFCLAAILCISSKPQHAPLGLFLWLLAIRAALSFAGVWRKTAALAIGTLLPLTIVVTLWHVEPFETDQQSWAAIFTKILNHSPAPLEDARELGLGPEYLRYVGVWQYQDPLLDPAFRVEFDRRTGRRQIAWFYLRHPWRALTIVYRDLHVSAPERPWAAGHYDRQSGFPPYTRPRSFGWWSFLRSSLFRLAPWHILVWYALVFAMGIRLAVRYRGIATSNVALLSLVLIGMGLVELAGSTLADAGETARHLTLFQFITDFTGFLAIGFIRVHPGSSAASYFWPSNRSTMWSSSNVSSPTRSAPGSRPKHSKNRPEGCVGLPKTSHRTSVPSSVKAPSATSQTRSWMPEASSKIRTMRLP